jgi:hypothetical protein
MMNHHLLNTQCCGKSLVKLADGASTPTGIVDCIGNCRCYHRYYPVHRGPTGASALLMNSIFQLWRIDHAKWRVGVQIAVAHLLDKIERDLPSSRVLSTIPKRGAFICARGAIPGSMTVACQITSQIFCMSTIPEARSAWFDCPAAVLAYGDDQEVQCQRVAR